MGVWGAASISATGGLVVTQDPDSALFPSMPNYAKAQGPADLVLIPDEMPEAIVEFIQSDKRIFTRGFGHARFFTHDG